MYPLSWPGVRARFRTGVGAEADLAGAIGEVAGRRRAAGALLRPGTGAAVRAGRAHDPGLRVAGLVPVPALPANGM